MTTGDGSFILLHEDRRASYGWRPVWAKADTAARRLSSDQGNPVIVRAAHRTADNKKTRDHPVIVFLSDLHGGLGNR